MNGNTGPYRASQIIAGAMIGGQVIFAAVSWWLHSSGSRTPAGLPMPLLMYVWIAVAIGGIAGALAFRARITEPDRAGAATAEPTTVQANVVIMWALLEMAGLFGIVIHFLEGTPTMLYATLGYIFVATVFFFPRREWFERSR